MKQHKKDTRWMAGVAMMTAVIILLNVTPLGLIQLPVIKATTTHIPVIIGAILFGPLAGGVLGGVFGICSIIKNTPMTSALSFAFSPITSMSLGFGFEGAVKSVWIGLGCRVLMGVLAGLVWIALKRLKSNDYVSLSVTAAVSSVLHTVLVMGSIYLLYTPQFAKAQSVAVEGVFKVVLSLAVANGIPEAIVATVLVTAIGKALLNVFKR